MQFSTLTSKPQDYIEKICTKHVFRANIYVQEAFSKIFWTPYLYKLQYTNQFIDKEKLLERVFICVKNALGFSAVRYSIHSRKI